MFSGSKLVLSNLKEYNKQVTNSPISIKLVTSGVEHYNVNNRRYKLKENDYIIVNSGDAYEIDIKTKTHTSGVCIYPPISMVQEVFNYRLKADEQLLENGTAPLTESKFTLQKSGLSTTATGNFLQQQLPYFIQNKQETALKFNSFYLGLAEHLVQDQLTLNKQLLRLKSTKKETKEELYRRVSMTKDYIHDNYDQKIIIDDLATLACMSKYHFLRSFRDFYKCTPYQYILKLKLEAAKQLLQKGFSYPQITAVVGFSDAKNLRKALRKFV